MTKHNPYAPSRASLKQSGNLGSSDEVRRDGKWVVMPHKASMPQRCIKCNGEIHEPTKMRTLYWHPGWVYVLLLVNLLIFIIVAVAVRKVAMVDPGLCLEHKQKRRNVIVMGWLGVVIAFVIPFMFAGTEYMGFAVGFSILLFLAVILFAMIRGRVVYAKRIDADEVRIGGCGEDFLDSLPGY